MLLLLSLLRLYVFLKHAATTASPSSESSESSESTSQSPSLHSSILILAQPGLVAVEPFGPLLLFALPTKVAPPRFKGGGTFSPSFSSLARSLVRCCVIAPSEILPPISSAIVSHGSLMLLVLQALCIQRRSLLFRVSILFLDLKVSYPC
ncbi:hypothetical protein I7I53_10874 [Histoplasma capsulatum var. duboisii H88]|uniref:Secreted protein n=1 Tax=Ajellomyces capsulatus (strain H88) TaxID=544711 RepID=A0A8A1L810_AJEC8|nr:hypothetical protein I7I53_10874 [Histoplasma capsulatum var. duboisii H88]